ncbi:hypothetical protein ABVT39_006493 [Epinephelus coioides]
MLQQEPVSFRMRANIKSVHSFSVNRFSTSVNCEFYRRDPSVKRTLCKKCCSLLIPGVTATTRQRRKKRKTRFTVVRCLSCGQSKTLLNDPDYCLWAERPEAQLENQKQPDPGPSGKKQPKGKKPDASVSSTPSAAQSTAST